MFIGRHWMGSDGGVRLNSERLSVGCRNGYSLSIRCPIRRESAEALARESPGSERSFPFPAAAGVRRAGDRGGLDRDDRFRCSVSGSCRLIALSQPHGSGGEVFTGEQKGQRGEGGGALLACSAQRGSLRQTLICEGFGWSQRGQRALTSVSGVTLTPSVVFTGHWSVPGGSRPFPGGLGGGAPGPPCFVVR